MFYFHCCSYVLTLRKDVGLCRWGHQERRACTGDKYLHGVSNFLLRYREWIITFIHRDLSIAKPEWHPWHQIPNKVSMVVLVRQAMWVTVNHSCLPQLKNELHYTEREVCTKTSLFQAETHKKIRNLRTCLAS